MALRAALTIFTSAATGLLLGSGAAALLAHHGLPLSPRTPPPLRAEAADASGPDATRVIAGGLFEPPPDPPPDDPGRPVAACETSARLVGVAVVHTEPAQAYAALVGPGSRAVVGIGSRFESLTVVAVEPLAALLTDEDGARCELRMFEPRAAEVVAPALETPSEEAPRGVEPLGEHRYRIDRSLLREAQTPRPRVRPIPTPDGVRLYGVRRGTPEHAAGLRNGDVLLSVDGQPLTDPSVALEAYGRALSGEPVRVVLERRGRRIENTYELSPRD